MALNSGYATVDGTERFKQRAMSQHGIHPDHFRQAPGGEWISSLSMGSYLGEPDSKDDALQVAAAKQSILSGAINSLDTAINYRFQLSERAFGQAINALLADGSIQRDEIFVCTKGGYITPDAAVKDDPTAYFTREYLEPGIMTPADVVGGMHCMTPAYLNNQLERSRKNLNLETIDLLYLHNAAESQIPMVGYPEFIQRLAQAFAFYEQARKEGRIRYYGMATWSCFRGHPEQNNDYAHLPDLVAMAKQIGGDDHGFRFIQQPFNLGLTEAFGFSNQLVGEEWQPILSVCQALGLGYFGSVPLMQSQLLAYASEIPKFEGLESPAERCIQFARSAPGMLSTIVGHKQPAHVTQNCHVATVAPATKEAFLALMKPVEA